MFGGVSIIANGRGLSKGVAYIKKCWALLNVKNVVSKLPAKVESIIVGVASK